MAIYGTVFEHFDREERGSILKGMLPLFLILICTMIKKILGVALALSVVIGITYAANDGRM